MNVPKLRFKEFNDKYNITKVSEIIDVIDGDRGNNYPKANDFYDSEFCLFLNAGNVTKNGFNFKNNQFITKEKDKKLRKGKLLINDIVLTTRGTVGNVAWFNEKTPYKNIRINSGMVINRIKENGHLLPEYLYSYMKSPVFEIQVNKMNYGSAQPQLTVSGINKFNIQYPTINEQKKVSTIMLLLDKKIELQSKKIEDLKLFKKGLDIKIFNNKKMFDVGIIKEYFESNGGTALEKYIDEKGTYNIISIGNYTSDGKYYDNGQKVIYNEKTKMKLLSKNDLAMILNDKTTTGDIIGSTILIDEDNKYIYNQRTQKLICKNINAEYSWCFFNSKYFRDKIFRLSQGGTQIYVNYSQIENQKIFIPKNKKIENDIVKSIFLITELIDNENDKFLKLQKLKKGLMQSMFV